jgi:hypothetical protein
VEYDRLVKINGFEIEGSLPILNEPHAIASIRPWVDAGEVGTLALERMESRFKARELARLAKPGAYFDFTRYRPTMHIHEGAREIEIPNTLIKYAVNPGGNDFIFLHLLEPHLFGESYASSIWKILQRLGVRRYCLVGGMYDLVPHTRPLLITGSSSDKSTGQILTRSGVVASHYQGPTTICSLIARDAGKAGVENLSILVHLPEYAEIEEDYPGLVGITGVLQALYHIPVDVEDVKRSEQQIESLNNAMQSDPKLKESVNWLEEQYDSRLSAGNEETEPRFSAEIDEFLQEQENRFKNI